MPKDNRGKNRKFGQHKDRQFEEVNEGVLIENMHIKDSEEEEEEEEQQVQ